jgi:hypothetical protein
MVMKINRPRGLISSIPIKMDSIIKHYFDKYRVLGKLPPLIQGKVQGKLTEDMPKTLKYNINKSIIIWGRPDDYLVLEDGSIIPFDHKTKSKEPTDIHRSYQLQMDVYSYLLEKNGFQTTNKAYLAFYYPGECDLHDGMPFKCKILEVKTRPSSLEITIKKACSIINEPIPKHGEECEYCKWTENTSHNKWQINKNLDCWIQ